MTQAILITGGAGHIASHFNKLSASAESLHLAVRDIDAGGRAARSGSASTSFPENTFG
jgi:hypothetical protein